MAFNEIFRIVSLRQSKRLPDQDSSAPDPRLQHLGRLQGQAAIKPSPREKRLLEMKQQYTQQLKKLEQLEKVQRAVVDVYMLVQQATNTPRPKSNGEEDEPSNTPLPLVVDTPADSFFVAEK